MICCATNYVRNKFPTANCNDNVHTVNSYNHESEEIFEGAEFQAWIG